MRTLGRSIATVVVTVGLALAVIEAGAYFWLVRAASDEQFRRFATLSQYRERFADRGESLTPYEPHRYLGYVPSSDYRELMVWHNAHGFRGDEYPMAKPEGEFRIVCLGSSTTLGLYPRDANEAAQVTAEVERRAAMGPEALDEFAREWGMRNFEDLARNFSYPGLLEQELRRRGYTHTRVINAGALGYTSLETLLNFELRCLDLDPDVVIVYEGYNDIHTRLVWPPRAYRGDNSGAIDHSSGWYQPLPWQQRSTAMRIALIASGRARSPVDLVSTFGTVPRTMRFYAYANQVAKGTYPAGPFVKTPAEKMLEVNRPVYFRRNLENIAAIARSRGIEPVLMTFASSGEPIGDTFDTPMYRQALEEHNEVIRAIGAAGGARVFDLAAEFPRDPENFSDIIHMTRQGGPIMARHVADYLVESGLLPSGAGGASE